jgi:hypothetical protein
MGKTVGKTESGKGVQLERTVETRWLVHGAGAASLEHIQIVPHEFHHICILICLPSRPTLEVNIIHYRYGPALKHHIKNILKKPQDRLVSLSGP